MDTSPPVCDPDKKSYKKIIVAVHGIGKQSRNSTIRSVTLMAAENLPGAHGVVSSSYPLGYFFSSGVGAAVNVSPFDEIPDGNETLKGIGFSEVFWADIPQGVVAESRTMEESKEWARTVVARAQRLYERNHPKPDGPSDKGSLVPPDFGLAAEVLDEIIDTVYVLENLSWLAEKAGLMTFDVREVMDEYLGDVQLVAEFLDYRNDIVGRFHRVMEEINDHYNVEEIHIVAHSEGSVVAFLGLLNALYGRRIEPAEHADGRLVKQAQANIPKEGQPDMPPLKWLNKVRGFMTIGSPIDKHFLLWPKLFEGFKLERAAAQMKAGGLAEDQIKWRNYYDLADPVGYKLDTIRLWLERGENLTANPVPSTCGSPHEIPILPRLGRKPALIAAAEERYRKRACKLFEFRDPADFPDANNDIGFTRYLLPGKAHNDYWDDVDLFNHFIHDVVNAGRPDTEATRSEPVGPPKTRRIVGIISALLPFLLSAVFLCAATYILLRGVISYYAPAIAPIDHYMRMMLTGYSETSDEYSTRYFLVEFVAWALMLAGTTIGARVHRLGGRRWIWWPLAFLMIAAGASQVDGKMILSFADIESAASWTKPKLALILMSVCLLVMVASDFLGRMHFPRKRARQIDKLVGARTRKSDPRERRLRWLFKGARPLVLLGASVTLVLSFVPSFGDVRLKREKLGLAISAKHLHHLAAEGVYDGKVIPVPTEADGNDIIRRLTDNKSAGDNEDLGTGTFAAVKRTISGSLGELLDEVEKRVETTLPEKWRPEEGEEVDREADLQTQEESKIMELAKKDPDLRVPDAAAPLAPTLDSAEGSAAEGNADGGDPRRERAARRTKQDYRNFLKVLDITPSVWPMLFSWLAFCYLWWLSILVFDLSYVWHRYVRKGDMIKCLVAWKFPKARGNAKASG